MVLLGDPSGVTMTDMGTFRIDVEIELIDHPELPSVGAGEAATSPIPGAIANAIFDATGKRLREVPLRV